MYKIAIVGASTLLGKELKDMLGESSLAVADFVLLDEDEGLGQLDQLGDEVTFVQPISPDAFERVDFTFFCGTETLTRKYWREALRAGSTVLDLSGALDMETGVLVRPRFSEINPGQVTGYAVALAGHVGENGAPRWYGGGGLAAARIVVVETWV